jgi:hypothetical protein
MCCINIHHPFTQDSQKVACTITCVSLQNLLATLAQFACNCLQAANSLTATPPQPAGPSSKGAAFSLRQKTPVQNWAMGVFGEEAAFYGGGQSFFVEARKLIETVPRWRQMRHV